MLELIMVIVIIGVLAALAVPQYAKFVEKARAVEALNYIGTIKKAALGYIAQTSSSTALTDIPGQLALTNETPLWRYSISYSPSSRVSGILFIHATRKSDDKFISLQYNVNDNSADWTGDHPGTPGGQTEFIPI